MPGGDSGVMEVLAKFIETNKRMAGAFDTLRLLSTSLGELQAGQRGGDEQMGCVHENEPESHSQDEDQRCKELAAIEGECSRLQDEVEYLRAQRGILMAEFDAACEGVDPHVLDNDTMWDRLQTEHKILEFWEAKVWNDMKDLVRKLEGCGCEEVVDHQRWESTQSQSISQSECTEASEEAAFVEGSVGRLSGSEFGGRSEEFSSNVEVLRGNESEAVDRNCTKADGDAEERECDEQDLAPGHTINSQDQQTNDESNKVAGKGLEEIFSTVGLPKQGGIINTGDVYFCNRLPELLDCQKEQGIMNSKSLELMSAADDEGEGSTKKCVERCCSHEENSVAGHFGLGDSKRCPDDADKGSLEAEVAHLREVNCDLEEQLQEMTDVVNDVQQRLQVAIEAKTEMEACLADMALQMKTEEDNLLGLKENLQGVSAAKRALHSQVICTERENKRLREELAEKKKENNGQRRNSDQVGGCPSQAKDEEMEECDGQAPVHITQREIEHMVDVQEGARNGLVKWAVRLGGTICGSILVGKLLNGLLKVGSKN